MFPTRKSVLMSQQLEKSTPNLSIFTPFKTVAEFFPAVINNKTKNIFPKELYCDLVDLNKKTNYKVILKESTHKDINSLIMKKLELWDKEHLENKEENTELLYKKLYIRYKNKNLEGELKKLELLNDMIKSKKNFNKIMDSNEGTNKILDEFFEKKNKEQGSILKNNIAKTKSRFNFSLFLTKTQKDIEQDFGVDSKTINAMNSQELDSDFYTKVIKNNLKYENQLYNELMTVNNDIYDKKSEKKDLAKRINEIYLEEGRLTTQYQDLIKEQKKGLDKFQDEYYEKNKRKNKSNKLSSLNKVKNLTSKANKAIKLGINLYKKISQKNDFFKNASTISRKHQMDLEIKMFKENYFSKMRELNIEKEQKLKEIKLIEEELSFYKQVNEILIEEHKIYYLNILKNGYDTRAEGLIWVVRNLLELQINLEYHHFPKFLTHEEIDFIIKRADMSLESKQLKIIMKILKKKQTELKEKEDLKKLNEASLILTRKKKDDDSQSERLFYSNIEYNNDLLRVKAEIDRRFIGVYSRHQDMFNRLNAERGIEEAKIIELIHSLRQGLFGRFKTDKNEKQILKIFKTNNTQRQIFSLLLYIRKRLDVLQYVSEKIIEEQIKAFKDKEEFYEDNNTIKAYMQNELVKKWLFGTAINI
jgi:hypothetical protein